MLLNDIEIGQKVLYCGDSKIYRVVGIDDYKRTIAIATINDTDYKEVMATELIKHKGLSGRFKEEDKLILMDNTISTNFCVSMLFDASGKLEIEEVGNEDFFLFIRENQAKKIIKIFEED